MSEIRNRRDLELRIELGLDRGLEETGIELIEGDTGLDLDEARVIRRSI